MISYMFEVSNKAPEYYPYYAEHNVYATQISSNMLDRYGVMPDLSGLELNIHQIPDVHLQLGVAY